MPIRLRPRPLAPRDMSPVSIRDDFELPEIGDEDSFRQVAAKLSGYFIDAIELPSTFEQLRTTPAGNCVRVLVDHLKATCRNPVMVHALLALKWQFAADQEHRGLSESRSNACEIVAWRFLARLSGRDAMDYCLYELPNAKTGGATDLANPHQPQQLPLHDHETTEESPLLSGARTSGNVFRNTETGGSVPLLAGDDVGASDHEADPTIAFKGLNALEIAAITDAKRFLSQHPVQHIVSGIWNGDIIFWDSLSVRAAKRPTVYDPETADPFSRLRVPKYLKTWEMLFFSIFLILYYTVLIARVETHLTGAEIALFIWIAAFAYDEWSEWADAGSIFYATDIWNLFDMTMITIGIVFAILRIAGHVRHEPWLTGIAFDVLSLEALLMMPRICSVLNLSPYWGTLIPCLKEMGKDFAKFMVLVLIVYLGFLTTFSLIGRDSFNLSKMAGLLTRIFFGSGYLGLDVMNDIDPFFGPPLMLIFVTLTSILLTGSLTGMLSNSFSRVIAHAREEHLYVYSVYVMEACTSNRLTHFYPPFNLIALVIFRPLRLIFSRDEKFRAARIVLLRVTHLPIVAAIRLYEYLRSKSNKGKIAALGRGRGIQAGTDRMRPRGRPISGYSRHHHWQSPRDAGASRTDDKRDDDDVEALSAVEVRVEELSRKLDKLTAAVLALRADQSGPGTVQES